MFKEVLIITRYFLPNLNVDSDAVYQMILGLKKIDPTVKIHIVTTGRKYKTQVDDDGKYNLEILKGIEIYKIDGGFSSPKSSLSKLFSDLIEGYKLVKKAKSLKIKNIISLSNPPLISLWHSLLLRRRNFFYWSFDIFPQAFLADRILKKGSVIYKIVEKLTYLNAPKTIIALGEYQYQFLQKAYDSRRINKVILPCGIHNEVLEVDKQLPFWKDSNVITLGYLGNLGRAHSIVFLKNILTSVANKSNLKLVLSVYGYHTKELLQHLDSTKANNIFLVNFIDKSQLSLIDVHLVSLMESWSNISVPSKAVSAICSGAALWYCGPDNVDTWEMFKECSFRSSDTLDLISQKMDALNEQELLDKKAKAIVNKTRLLDTEKFAYKSILDLFE